MRIIDMMKTVDQFISLEFFPPKEKDKWPGYFKSVDQLKACKPLFVSVTYGAGGSTRDFTLEIVSTLKKEHKLEPMAHLTCVGASEEYIHTFLQDLKAADIDNIMALRGDPPKGQDTFIPDSDSFRHASDLTAFIRKNYPEFCLGVAGYPEKHVQAPSMEEDLKNLKFKLDQGGDFVVTQLFFDNKHYYDFVEQARNMGIHSPIVPGIIPILSLNAVKRMLSMGGGSIPEEYMRTLEQADAEGGNEAVRAVSIAHAQGQIRDLLENGAPGVHLYTLNQAEISLKILNDETISRRTGNYL